MTAVDSRIESVRVYCRGATVHRIAQLRCDDGLPEMVEFSPLPLALIDPTARMRVLATEPSSANVTSRNIRVGLHAPSREQAPADGLHEELKAAERDQLLLEQQLRHLELEQRELSSVGVPERPRPALDHKPLASPLAARLALEDFVAESVQARVDELRALRQRKRELDRKVGGLRDRAERSSTAREAKPRELSKVVMADLVDEGATPPTTVTLELEYHVPGARWAPSYQCRLSRDCRHADLQLRAMVAHQSGEDWRGVKLSVSTAEPLFWSELPDLPALRVTNSRRRPVSRRAFRPPPRGANALFLDYDRDSAPGRSMLPALDPWEPPMWSARAPALPPNPDGVIPATSGDASLDATMDEDTGHHVASDVYEEELGFLPEASEAHTNLAFDGEGKTSSQAGHETPTRVQPAVLARGGNVAAPAASLFGQLRLGAPDDATERNRLIPVDRRSAYLATLARSAAEVHVDVLEVVDGALREAEAVAELPLPPACYAPEYGRLRFDYSYRGDGPVDVDGDALFHSVPLCTHPAESSVCYVMVPREEPHAYRMVSLHNPLEGPLLPGPVEIYVGDEYVLTNTLAMTGRGGELSFALGVEQAIKVTRHANHQESRSGEHVVAMSELENTIEIAIENTLPNAARCEVRECIPQPDDDAEVVVEELSVSPAWETYDQLERGLGLRGGRRWIVDVPGGAQQSLSATYLIKLYASNELVGGNRREA